MNAEEAKARLLAELPKPFGEWAARQVNPNFSGFKNLRDAPKIHEIVYGAFAWSGTEEGPYFWEAIQEAAEIGTNFPLGGFMWAGWSVAVWEDRLTIGCQKIDPFHFLIVKDWLNGKGGINELQTGGGYDVELYDDMVIEEAKVISKDEVWKLINKVEEIREKKEK